MPITRRLVLTASPAIALGGCATIEADLGGETVLLQGAVTFYGIALGIAQVAELADPLLIPVVAVAVAILQPLVDAAKADLAAASLTAAQAFAQAETIRTQAVALVTTTAHAVAVVPTNSLTIRGCP